MTPLPLDRPLAGLLERSAAAGRKLSQRDLGELRQPMVSAAAVGDSLRLGDRIKLSSLAAYARAAGYRLFMQATRTKALRETRLGQEEGLLSCAVYSDLDVTVAGARALLEALGLEMTLAVEPAAAPADPAAPPRERAPAR